MSRQGNGYGGLLTAAQAAELLNVPASWVLAEARADRIPYVPLGRYEGLTQSSEAWWRERARGPWRDRGAARLRPGARQHDVAAHPRGGRRTAAHHSPLSRLRPAAPDVARTPARRDAPLLPMRVDLEARLRATRLESGGMSARNLHLVSASRSRHGAPSSSGTGESRSPPSRSWPALRGLGKTTLLKNIGAAATRGTLPGDLEGEPTSVIYASAEDSPETTLPPRHLAHGGDPARLYFVEVRARGQHP